jgi:hypothetical protein
MDASSCLNQTHRVSNSYFLFISFRLRSFHLVDYDVDDTGRTSDIAIVGALHVGRHPASFILSEEQIYNSL